MSTEQNLFSEAECYEILQVSPNASPDVIKAAFVCLTDICTTDMESSRRQDDLEALCIAFLTIMPESEVDLDGLIRLDPDSPRGLLFRAETLANECLRPSSDRNSCLLESSKACVKLASICPGTAYELEALRLQIRVEQFGLKAYAKAARTMERLIEKLSEGSERESLIMSALGCYMEAAVYHEAVRVADLAVLECSDETSVKRAHRTRADALAAKGSHKDAINAYAFLETQYPDKASAPYAAFRIARILDTDLKRYSDAIKAYQHVLDIYSYSTEANDCKWRIDHIRKRYIEKRPVWEWIK